MPAWVTVTLVAAGVPAVVLGVVRSTFVVVTVFGTSMTPTLDDGDRVLLVRRRVRPVRRGDVVAARLDAVPGPKPTPGTPRPPAWIIKRAAAVGGDAVPGFQAPASRRGDRTGSTVPPGTVFLLGDNGAASDDSRVWGPLPLREIVGVMVRRLPRRM